MSRRVAQVDANQAQIVKALRSLATVQSLAAVGDGCPDLLVGFRGVNVLLEVKNLERDHGRPEQLRPSQAKWHASWAGRVYVVTSPVEALDAVVDAARPREEATR